MVTIDGKKAVIEAKDFKIEIYLELSINPNTIAEVLVEALEFALSTGEDATPKRENLITETYIN